jgi:hypothetical protein
MGDQLYYGHVEHDQMIALFPESARTELTEDDDFTTTVFMLAESMTEAERFMQEKYKANVPMTLVPSGVAAMSVAWGGEVNVQVGLRGDIDPQELEKCPECRSNHVRHDASAGATDCVSCGWSMGWKGTE